MNGTRRFAPGWPMTVFTLLMLPTVIALGFWQLDRAAEKRGYEAQYFDRVGMLPVAPPASLDGAAFERVRLRGSYRRDHDYLVDNRVRDGRPGYWVVSEFAAADGRVFLVNRGWLAAPSSRAELPQVRTPGGTVTLVGVVWPDTGLPPLLAADDWPADWPRRVQRLDVRRMAALDPRVVAAEIRLEADQPGALDVVPADADFLPQRHLGYAVQWFGLGLVLTIGYAIFGLRRG